MKYVAAYALLVLGGNAHPTEAQVSALIESVSGSVDKAKLSALATALKGKDLNAVIADGLKKVGTIGASTGSAPASAPAGKAAAPAAAPKKEEPKKEEPKEEEFEGAGDLFDF